MLLYAKRFAGYGQFGGVRCPGMYLDRKLIMDLWLVDAAQPSGRLLTHCALPETRIPQQINIIVMQHLSA